MKSLTARNSGFKCSPAHAFTGFKLSSTFIAFAVKRTERQGGEWGEPYKSRDMIEEVVFESKRRKKQGIVRVN